MNTPDNEISGAMDRLTKIIHQDNPAQLKAQADSEAHAKELKARRAQEIIAAANAPARHLACRSLDRTGEWERKRKWLMARIGTGFTLALIGNRGNGKTQIGVELIRALAFADKPKQSRFCSAMEFFMAIKAGYRNDSRSEAEVITDFQKPALLVMDEVGKRSESEWENRLLYEMLNRRYNDLKDTLLISNQSEKEFRVALGDSLVSRMSGLIECKWGSYRKP